ncbi:MAG: LD-carboxypeptidase [Bacteroidales bacterium]|nr:LD-carboxypeptidase [Bacteroidales bacterium]MDZ4205223.1 LD-carboxypeptidase [Bacteroidales bacterium]
MNTPPYLRQGDRIGVVTPARFVTPEDIEPALKHIQGWGLDIVRGQHLYARHHQFAGTDEQRLADLQAMLDNDSIRAIIFARGGYGTLRIIDRLDFHRLALHPKWIVGYSDITVLHAHLEKQIGTETLHAPMLVGFDGSAESLASMESLRKTLFGETLEYSVSPGQFSKIGTAHSTLTGGNLSLLYALAGSESETDISEKVLFIEDVDEYLYHIDRMMHQLKRSGKLKNLAGLLVGSMSKMRDNNIPFGKTAEEIIHEAVKDYQYPVLMGFSAGHEALNNTLIMGRNIILEVSKNEARIQFEEKVAGTGNKKAGSKFLKSLLYISILFLLIYSLYYFIMNFMLK